MRLDERAQKTCNAFLHLGYINALIKAFRDQIEECAKVADAEAREYATHSQGEECAQAIGYKIRALASPPDDIEDPARLYYE